MTPYLGSLEWYSAYACGRQLPLKSRDAARTLVASPSWESLRLSVPVEGGASAVKRLPFGELRVSMHGDWPRIHLGALDAAYGRTPYFRHILPGIRPLLQQPPLLLEELNAALLSELLSFLDFRKQYPALLKELEARPERMAEIRAELWRESMPQHAFLEAAARFGRDALFLLLPAAAEGNVSEK